MSRRHDDLRMKPSIVSLRDRRDDFDQETYFPPRRGGAREELSLRSRKSLSPQGVVERSRRTMVRDPRSNSIERRRDYEQQRIDRGRGGGSGGGGGNGGGGRIVVSRSPPIEHPQKRVYVDGRGFVASPTSMKIQGDLEYVEYVDYDDSNIRPQNSYGYEDIEVVKEKDFPGRRSGTSGHRSLVESVPFEDAVNRDVVLHPQYGNSTKLVESRGNYSTIDMQRVKDEKTRYQEAVFRDKMAKDVYYKDGEQSAYYRGIRESGFIDSSLSQIKDFGNEDLQQNHPSTSSGYIVRGEYITKLRDGRTLPPEGYPKRYGKDLETLESDDYGQRIVLDTRRGYGEICRDPKCHACEVSKSSRLERKDHLYPEIGVRGDDEISYASQEHLYTKIKYAREEDDPRDYIRQDIIDSNVEVIANTEGSHPSRRIIKNVGAREYEVIQREMDLNYVDTRRKSDVLNQGGDYLDSEYPHVQLTRKVSNHRHITDHGSLHEHEFEDPRLGNGYGRYAPSGSNRTRMKNYSDLKNIEMQRIDEGFERIKADEPIDNVRVLKRKYIVDEDVSRMESRGEIRSKRHIPSGDDDFHGQPVEWTNRKTNIMPLKRPGYENDHYVESKDISDRSYYKDSSKISWTSYHDQSENIQEHSGKPFKTGSRHIKGYSKSESSKSYSHTHHSHQSSHYKQQNLRQKYEHDNSVDVVNDHVAPWKSDPLEESEGFKQRIQAAFLDFSKRFNENPTARKLYKEEGKAGSLFCVVCRRSVSKEFLNTKALATHAFMSHKVGLRPHHLGLHRAICVLMGWNTMPDPETGTWAPELLPKPEALAQKEDLILWPPLVVVHNISLSYNDHNKWKLINIDALEEFLRGKSFHLGKMKICLGNPGDHSVILVKFLATFSGLQEAERLHKLFMERKHGRVDFEEAISGNGPVDEGGNNNENEKLEDTLLYGYMGISEDLDIVDFDTKKRCLVKSKKEIHELADAPVKPE